MTIRKRSKEGFNEFLKVLINQQYPEVQPQNPDLCIADYLQKRRSLNKGNSTEQ